MMPILSLLFLCENNYMDSIVSIMELLVSLCGDTNHKDNVSSKAILYI